MMRIERNRFHWQHQACFALAMNLANSSLLVCVWVACVTAPFVSPAATTNATRRPQPERWLIVVETSSKMEKRAKALEGAIGDLLASGMNGELKEGDQIGIWTYNKKLFAGVAPMQTWIPAQSNKIAGRSAHFIGGQKFQSKPNLDNVVPELNRLAKASRKMTILLISDGSQKFSGTPFDDAINAAYASFQPSLEKTRMPLITVLRSERGEYIGQSVSFAPWPIEFPPFKLEADPKPATSSAKKTGEKTKSIIIGTPKPTAPATNVLIISPKTTAAPGSTNEVKPVPAVSLEPTPIVDTVQPKPVSTSATKPIAPTPISVEPAKTSAPPVRPAAPAPVTVAPPTTPSTAAVAPTPAANPQPKRGSGLSKQKWLLILGMGCLWVAIVIALVMVRRSRRPQTASLITRSFDRNQR